MLDVSMGGLVEALEVKDEKRKVLESDSNFDSLVPEILFSDSNILFLEF